MSLDSSLLCTALSMRTDGSFQISQIYLTLFLRLIMFGSNDKANKCPSELQQQAIIPDVTFVFGTCLPSVAQNPKSLDAHDTSWFVTGLNWMHLIPSL